MSSNYSKYFHRSVSLMLLSLAWRDKVSKTVALQVFRVNAPAWFSQLSRLLAFLTCRSLQFSDTTMFNDGHCTYHYFILLQNLTPLNFRIWLIHPIHWLPSLLFLPERIMHYQIQKLQCLGSMYYSCEKHGLWNNTVDWSPMKTI